MAKVYAVIGSNCITGSHTVDALLADPSNQVFGISRSLEYKDIYLPYKQRPANNSLKYLTSLSFLS